MSEDRNLNQTPSDAGVSRREFGAVSLAAGLAAVAGASASAVERPLTETDVMVKTPDGTCDAVFIHPTTGTYPGVLVWRPSLRQAARAGIVTAAVCQSNME